MADRRPLPRRAHQQARLVPPSLVLHSETADRTRGLRRSPPHRHGDHGREDAFLVDIDDDDRARSRSTSTSMPSSSSTAAENAPRRSSAGWTHEIVFPDVVTPLGHNDAHPTSEGREPMTEQPAPHLRYLRRQGLQRARRLPPRTSARHGVLLLRHRRRAARDLRVPRHGSRWSSASRSRG